MNAHTMPTLPKGFSWTKLLAASAVYSCFFQESSRAREGDDDSNFNSIQSPTKRHNGRACTVCPK
jgi:hypothetical protein